MDRQTANVKSTMGLIPFSGIAFAPKCASSAIVDIRGRSTEARNGPLATTPCAVRMTAKAPWIAAAGHFQPDVAATRPMARYQERPIVPVTSCEEQMLMLVRLYY